MSVKNTHPAYDKYAPLWKTMRDVCAGQTAVHQAGPAYLPRLSEQSDGEYAAYKGRALFYNATWRTVAGMIGMMFRKAPQRSVPAGLEGYLADIDLGGSDFDTFAKSVVYEVMTTGRVGLMVDYPQAIDSDLPLTRARVEALGIRPSIQLYATESLINWRYARVNNAQRLVMVVLKERAAIVTGDFDESYEDRYRVLDLDGDGVYRVRVFRIGRDGKDEVLEEFRPVMDGRTLGFIPFFVVTPDGSDCEVSEPPLIDLAHVNINHYRSVADYEHGCHFTGLPTAWIAGYMPENIDKPDRFGIGSTAAWTFSHPDTKVGYLEFTGQGLNALRDNIAGKERQMVVLGARMLAEDKAGVEAFRTLALRNAGETATLSAIAVSVSAGLTRALGTLAQWAGVAGDIVYELNRDFAPVLMDAPTLTALVAGWQSGAFSDQVLFDALKRGDVIAGDVAFEDEQARRVSCFRGQ